MKRATAIAKLIVLLLLAAFLLALTVSVVQLENEMLEVSQRAKGLMDNASVLVENTDDRVNELHGAIAGVAPLEKKAGLVEDAALARMMELQPVELKATGVEDAALLRVNEFQSTISEVHSLLFDARGSVAEMNHAALAERKYFEVQIPATTDKLNAAIDGLLPVETNAAAMTSSFAAISEDGRKMADKETTDFLKPVPWYMKPVKRFGEIWDVTAAVARHVP